MKGGIGNLMKQAQAMQAAVQKAQAEIATLEVTGESGGGMVKVTMNGRHEASRVTLDPAKQQRWDEALAAMATARRAPLYKLVDGKPRQVQVQVGASDGSNTEVSGNIREGDQVIVGAARAATPAP